MNPARVVSLVSLIALSTFGCSSSTPHEKPTQPEVSDEADAAPSSEESPATTSISLPSADAAGVSVLSFGSEDRLLVGYKSGWMADLDPRQYRGQAFHVSKKGIEVEAISPDGSLLILGSAPPAAVNSEGALILNMNSVEQLESAAFAREEFSLYVSSPDGTIRVWGQAHSFEDPRATEKMEDYINRQASDFFIQVNPLRGPIHPTGDGRLIFVDESGTVSIWNPRKPSESSRVMQLDSAPVSISSAGNRIVTTSQNRDLKVGRIDPPEYRTWSRDAKADYAATSHGLHDAFFELNGTELSLRSFNDGEVKWSVSIDGSRACGLAVSANGRRVAACVDGVVSILSGTDGSLDSQVWLTPDGVAWQTASGESIPMK